MVSRIRGSRRSVDIWPGFVDALSGLLIIILFVSMVFMVAQFFLSEALSGSNKTINRLNAQIAELANILSLEKKKGTEGQKKIESLTAQLAATIAARNALTTQVDTLRSRVSGLEARLSASTLALKAAQSKLSGTEAGLILTRSQLAAAEKKLAELEQRLIAAQASLVQSRSKLAASQKKLTEAEKRRLADQALLALARSKLAATQTKLTAAERRLLADQALLALSRSKLALTTKNLSAAEAKLALAEAKLRDVQAKILRLETRLGGKDAELEAEKKVSQETRRQLVLLNQQVLELRKQLAAIQEALDAAEAEKKVKDIRIKDLGTRLNAALATKVQKLQAYRSEFFGRLRELIGKRGGIKIVGDRFVFQSEVLFPSGSDVLQPGGVAQLLTLSGTLKEIAGKIPKDIKWVLRVDGHTDVRPINSATFKSNWELSAARAIAVVKFLIAEGIPPGNLVAAGFGEHQPLDNNRTSEAYARNRRIELKLTQR